ncbi:flagellar L-ring protein precursor FlgH [Formivibrio citricus]|uniref:Flagellar L-ring protein n=1 Tax=Formivibrio citricus TaxID=83765 RepID=A0A1I4ZW28_9NEIS|nr:flagellar basal body L-ring protein FlgH [Formivibrio citricus]SFN54436.1 flagellar L-ring protein precursor FlgH [Formivibrio citricus]
MKFFAGIFLSLLLVACTAPSVITQPTTAKPHPASLAQVNNGAIYQPGSAKLLFEEPVARYVGDTLIVTIEENLATANKTNTSSSRTGSYSMTNSGASSLHLPTALEQLLNASPSGSSSNKSDGKGETSNTNTFKGTLAVTVVETLPNGNLVVGGEKRVNVNGEINNLRLTGVVNPKDIKAGNTISSTRIADARIEQVGEGVIADANTIAWLLRFFLSVLPL